MLVLSLLWLAMTAVPRAEPGDVGPWKVENEGSRVFVTQRAGTSWDSGSPQLVLRCRTWDEPGKWFGKNQRERDVYLFHALGFGSDEGDLLVSFPGEPEPKKYHGAASEDGKSLFLRGGFSKGVDGFIRSLRTHASMTVVVKPKKKEPLPAFSFDLAQVDEALKPLLELCPMKEK